MSREVLLSSVLGFASGGVATYALHRALWKSADAQATRIEHLMPSYVPPPPPCDASAPYLRPATKTDTLEGYMRQRAAQGWNSVVDSVHGRLLGLPRTLVQIRDDAAAMLEQEEAVPELLVEAVESVEGEGEGDGESKAT